MSTEPSYSERELLKQVAESNEKAFRRIFDLYRIRLFSFILDFTHSPADAEELVQEAFIRLWENRSLLTAVDHPRNYIYTMARNNALNWLARVARNEQMVRQIGVSMLVSGNRKIYGKGMADLLITKDSKGFERYYKDRIDAALACLSGKKQAIYRLSREQGLAREEIARVLDLSESSVRNNLVETLKFLEACLDNTAFLLPGFSSMNPGPLMNEERLSDLLQQYVLKKTTSCEISELFGHLQTKVGLDILGKFMDIGIADQSPNIQATGIDWEFIYEKIVHDDGSGKTSELIMHPDAYLIPRRNLRQRRMTLIATAAIALVVAAIAFYQVMIKR